MSTGHTAKAARIDTLTPFSPLPGGPLVIPALNSLVQGINSCNLIPALNGRRLEKSRWRWK